jgi:hypothetical protein
MSYAISELARITKAHASIAILGSHSEAAAVLLLPMLQQGGVEAQIYQPDSEYPDAMLVIVPLAYDYPDLAAVKATAVLLLPSEGDTKEAQVVVHRFLRNLPYRRGLVVAYEKDRLARVAAKGFSYAFRWYSVNDPWPGLARYAKTEAEKLELTAVARIAHEMGCSSAQIQHSIKQSYITA